MKWVNIAIQYYSQIYAFLSLCCFSIHAEIRFENLFIIKNVNVKCDTFLIDW